MSMTAARLYLVGVLSAPLLGFATITTNPANVEFTVSFDGVGAEGIDDLWRGSLANPNAGMITIRVEHLSNEMHQPMTAGPIHAEVFVSQDDVTQSFGADVAGSIDQAGVLHLTGTVDVGPRAGMPVDVTARLDPRRLNGHGLIRFLSLTARR